MHRATTRVPGHARDWSDTWGHRRLAWGIGLLVAYLTAACGAGVDRPRAEDGVLDLTDWDFASDGSVDLSGEWSLAWGQLLDPATLDEWPDLANPETLDLPAMWNPHVVDGAAVGPNGYATFWLEVRLPSTSDALGLRFHSMGTAYTLYADGQFVAAAGTVGDSRADSVPDWRPQVADLGSVRDTTTLVLHVSNFHHRKGGPVEVIELGLANQVHREREQAVAVQMFLAGAILMIGLYHLGLAVIRRRERSSLFFAFFCLLIGVYTLLSGERYFATLFPDASWEARVRLTNLTSFLSLPVFLSFIASLFPDQVIRRPVRVIQAAMGVLAVLVLATPARVYTPTIPVFHLLVLAGSVLILATLSRALRARVEGGLTLLLGFVVFLIAIVNDVLYDNLVIETGQYIYVGLFVFIFAQTVLLSMRYSRAFDTVESQRSELVRTAAAHSQLEAQLWQAQKMDAIGTLAGGVAHDFRNQLTVITGFTSLLAEDPEVGSAQRDSLAQIEAAADRSTTLTDQLLSFSRKALLQPVVLDVHEVLTTLLGPLSRLLPEDIEVVVEARAEQCFVKVDRTRFEQALMNLAINARDAMPDGGVLVLSHDVAERDPRDVGREGGPAPHVIVRIRDSGMGMDEATMQRIFEPFFTTKNQGRGSGLGLAMTYGFVEQSNGWITVSSTPGEGAEFTINLPRCSERPPAPTLDQNPDVVLNSGDGRILVTEDDPTVRHFVATALRSRGHEVVAPDSVKTSLALIRRGEAFDLLLTDVVMPEMSGPALAKLVRELCPGIEVLFMSGYNESTLVRKGVVREDVHFMSKPFSAKQLVDRVHEILGEGLVSKAAGSD